MGARGKIAGERPPEPGPLTLILGWGMIDLQLMFPTRGILRFQLKRASVEKLKQDLEEQYYVAHLLIAELIRRGEAVEQFWPYVLSLLKSDSDDKRRFGWHNLNIWFP